MFLFIGEKPSNLAFDKGWTWKMGRLAAKTLFDGLIELGIDPAGCDFYNLFGDSPDADERASPEIDRRLAELRKRAQTGDVLVAMGQKVAAHLKRAGISHRSIRHPAARGAGRQRKAYHAHLRERLAWVAAGHLL